MPNTHTTVATLILALTATASASFSPDSSTSSAPVDSNAEFYPEMSAQLMAVNDAVQATREDPSAMCFVVALPEYEYDAQLIRDLWTTQESSFDHDTYQVFFVRGQDAQFVLENSFIESAPAFISFRNGRPYHSRTGTFTQDSLLSFVELSTDFTSPTTNAPDQTAYLYESMNQLALESQDETAAQGACSIMLNLHALIHGPYSSSYSADDIASMKDLYNQTQITLATLDTTNPVVLSQIDTTRQMGMKTWNTRTDSTFGIGIWIDLASISGNESELLQWIDNGLESPAQFDRVSQSLAEYGQSIASLLINTNRFDALSMTITSPEQVADYLANASTLSSDIASISGESSNAFKQHISSATDTAAAYHAALLMAGRNSEAWEVAQIAEDFAGPTQASVSICTAAINAGVIEDRHAFLVRNLNQAQHASLINDLNTSFAVVPTSDD